MTDLARAGRGYPTDVTDVEWALLAPLWAKPAGGPGRPRRVDLRRVVNGLRYVARTGCQWRLVPRELGYWGTVRYYFCQFTAESAPEVCGQSALRISVTVGR